eukprot:5780147-Pyramimonas_sp.AAC.2
MCKRGAAGFHTRGIRGHAERWRKEAVVRTVASTTMSGRKAANNGQYMNYRQMMSGTTRTQRRPTQRQRRIGEDEGNYETCGKCIQRLGDLLMCDTEHCREAFYVECVCSVGLVSEVTAGLSLLVLLPPLYRYGNATVVPME